MSIIGPRPLLVSYLPWYTEEEKQRHDVRPGLSGLAQVNGRNSVTWEEKFSWDLKYVDRITFLGDVKITLDTVKKAFIKVEGVELNHEGNLANIRKKAVEEASVILYRRENGAYVLHRVMENSDHNSYVLCGDNQYRKEYGVQPEQILAALTGFYRGNQYIDCEKNKKYKQYVKLWCSPLFPRRCAVWAVKAVMKIRSRASKR